MGSPTFEGQILAGKFRVERVLGEGEMGVVVAARHLELDEPVALKFLHAAAVANTEALARFLREARAATKIKNEHVAKVLDVGKLDDGAPYIVMEHLQGTDLADHLSARGPLPVATAVNFVLQALEAIAEAHQLGIVHRDLKPSNLFVARGSDGMPLVKVLDFGISKILAGKSNTPQQSLTHTESLLGSPLYMSPEQLTATKSVDEHADIWALGVILYELLTGKSPFIAESLPQICTAILHLEPPAPRSLRFDLPADLEAIIAVCLRKGPRARFADVALLASALAPFDPVAGRLHAERILRIRRPGSTPPAIDVHAATMQGATTPLSPAASTLEPASSTLRGDVAMTPASPSLATASGPWRVIASVAVATLTLAAIGLSVKLLPRGHHPVAAAIIEDASPPTPAVTQPPSIASSVTVAPSAAPSAAPSPPVRRPNPAPAPRAGALWDTQK